MSKWKVTLSTTEPENHVGIIKVRQGNRGTETLEMQLTEHGVPLNLTQCKTYIEAFINNFAVQRSCEIVDAAKGIIRYTFDEYTMQDLHEQTANILIYKNDDLIGTTQDFTYFMIKAVSKTPGEMGSYWQTIEDLINDMTAFINAGKGEFTDWMNARKEEFDAWRKKQEDGFESWREGQEGAFEKWKDDQQITFETWRENQKADYLLWFESIKSILSSIDPGGVMLSELMDARVDLKGVRHESIRLRLVADLEYIYERVKHQLDLVVYKTIPVGYKVTIEHDSEYQPEISVTYYENSIDTEIDGFDSSGQFGGGTIFKVVTQLSYDRKKAHVEMPLFYALKQGEFIIQNEHTLLIIEGNRTLNFTVNGAKISTAYLDDLEPEVVRIPRDLELLILDDATIQLKWRRGITDGNNV